MRISIGKDTDWFEQMTEKEQDAYVTEHPRSKYAKQRRTKDTPASKKPLRANMLTRTAKMTDKGRVDSEGHALPEHIQKIGIPPAWTDVRYNPDPNADLLCTGRDAKGRLQPVYSEKFAKTQAEAKFLRVQALASKFQDIQEQNKKSQASRNPRTKDSADCMSLVMSTGLRPGSDSDTGAAVKAYGATTLEGKHIQVKNGKVTLDFIGKKGVHIQIPVHDERVATMLKRRKKEAGDDGKLFAHTNDGALLDYTHTLDGGNYKVKDFRTHLGTHTALAEIAKMDKPANEKEYKKAVMAVAKKVSAKLGNSPVMALQAYINPVVFSEWRT